jgi:hypothetical protein
MRAVELGLGSTLAVVWKHFTRVLGLCWDRQCILAGIDMLSHHVLTLALFVVGRVFSVDRMGFYILALLNVSNPFMHAAKVLNNVGASKGIKALAFLIFGCMFALSRCMLFPMLMVTSMKAVIEHIRDGDMTVVTPAIVCFTGLTALQLLQFYWLVRIIRCVRVPGRLHARKRLKTYCALAYLLLLFLLAYLLLLCPRRYACRSMLNEQVIPPVHVVRSSMRASPATGGSLHAESFFVGVWRRPLKKLSLVALT